MYDYPESGPESDRENSVLLVTFIIIELIPDFQFSCEIA